MKNIILLIFSLMVVFILVSYDSFFNDQKVKEIVMIGNLNHANNKKISNTLNKLIGEKLYQVSLTDIKEELEEDPWLDTAQVIIRKPDVLVVRLIEFSPIYLWNDKVYIDKNGNKMIPRSYPIKKILKLRSNVSSSNEAHNFFILWSVVPSKEFCVGIKPIIFGEIFEIFSIFFFISKSNLSSRILLFFITELVFSSKLLNPDLETIVTLKLS